jgi:hypothetical protein
MTLLGVVFLVLGGPGFSLVCCAAVFGPTSWSELQTQFQVPVLLFVAWGVTPVVSGLLLLSAAQRLTRPRGEAAGYLVLAAGSAFVGLAWLAVTAALLFQ